MIVNCPVCGFNRVSGIFNGYFQCRDCATAFNISSPQEVIPAPPSEDEEKVYKHSKEALFREGLQNINRIFPQKGTLLDIGCGYGYFMKLATEDGWDCEGIEISKNAVVHCRDVLNLKVYDRPLQELNLQENFYSVVSLWGVLDVLPSPVDELLRVHRLLKNRGIIFLRVNNFSFHLIAWKLGNIKLLRFFDLKPGIIHRWGINSKSLRYMLKKAGFEKIKIYNSKPTVGDPYGTGGKLGGVFVSVFKKLYYVFAQIIYYLTFKKLLISSSLFAIAYKDEKNNSNNYTT